MGTIVKKKPKATTELQETREVEAPPPAQQPEHAPEARDFTEEWRQTETQADTESVPQHPSRIR